HFRGVEADGARHAVAELRGVLDVVHAGDGVMTAEQERGVVARITMPRRRIGRSRLAEGEARELDEQEFSREARAGRVREAGERRRAVGIVELDIGLSEGADNAVFRRGARIDGERQTRTGLEIVLVAGLQTVVATPVRRIVDAAVERGIDAQITAELDASISARNVPESGTIQGADPHVFDRFGLYGKISRLSPTHDDQGRR